MLTHKVRFASLTAVAALAWIALSPGHSPTVGQEPASAQDQGAKIKGLQKEWLDTLRDVVREEQARAKNAQGVPEEVIAATRMLAEAELEACESDKDRVTALEKILLVARDTEKLAVLLAKTGQGRESAAHKAKAERLRFEIALERAKSKAAAKPAEGQPSQAVRRGQVALAEKQAAIKQAAVKVAEAQKAKAQASLATIKAQVAQGKAAESHAETQLQRFSDLFKTNAIEERIVDEQRGKLESAKAKRVAAEAQVAEAEAQVAIEQARIALAQLEFEEAQLRLEQAKARFPSR